MPEKDRVFTPSRLYDLQVKIKDLDYTNDVINVMINSSLSTAYHVITLTMNIDPNDIIIEELFGGEPINIGITLIRENKYPGPRIDFELMFVSSDFPLSMKDESSRITQKDRVPLNIITVARQPYKIMNTLVNRVFIGTTLKQVIEQLAQDVKAKIIYDITDQNTNKIKQLCIPPSTLYNIIKEYTNDSNNIFDGYLDQRFGLFNGTAGVFCIDNTIYIKNLSGKLKQAQTFTIYELGALNDQKEFNRILEECNDGKTFYTYSEIETDYAGNAKFAKIATNLKHIVKPYNTITTILSQDLKEIAKNYSLKYQNKGFETKLFIDKNLDRTRYYNEDSGHDIDLTLFNSRFGRSVSNTSTLSLDIERNLPVLNLLNVGECVKFKPKTIEYLELEGKYILWSSTINFINNGNWETTGTINLIRTNKKS